MENGNAIKVREHGFTNATDQTWYITNTGEYRNNMVFAATYDVRFENGNFYPFEVKDFVLSQGIMCMISRLFLIFASKVQK